MALYGNLQFANVERLFNLGKANGGFFITSYIENESNEGNLERAWSLRQKISDKGLAYVPVFCGTKNDNALIAGKCCFYVLNKKKNCIYDDALLSGEVLFKFSMDLCNEFNQQYFIFLDKGEIKSFSKSGRAVGLFSPNVIFANLVSSVFPFSIISSDDDQYFVRSFETLSGKSANCMSGELFLRKDELPSEDENWIVAG